MHFIFRKFQIHQYDSMKKLQCDSVGCFANVFTFDASELLMNSENWYNLVSVSRELNLKHPEREFERH